MPTTRRIGLFALTAAVILLAWSAFAQQQPPNLPPPIPRGEPKRPAGEPGQPAAQVDRPATAPAAGQAGDKRALEIVSAALEKYRSAKSYQDRFELRLDFRGVTDAGKPVEENEVQTSGTLHYAGPNRVALVTPAYSVYSNGKKLWLYNDDVRQFIERPAGERFDYDKARSEVGALDPPHPVLYVLHFARQGFAELFPRVSGLKVVGKEERGGRPGWRLAGSVDPQGTALVPPGMEMEGVLLPLTLWFDEQTGLLGEAALDLTEPHRRDLAAAQKEAPADRRSAADEVREVKSAVATLQLDEVKLDAEIPAATFEFEPGADAAEVDEFRAVTLPAKPEDLVGKEAPEFSGTAFDGKPIALQDLRGRVVVLDFWATWCVPCVAALPSVQKVCEKYAAKPVTFIGIDQDAAKQEEKARKLIESKKLTFRQVLDADRSIGKSFNITQIPCSIVIDPQGVVRVVHTGGIEKLEEELAADIERVLKGESALPPIAAKPVVKPIRTSWEPRKAG
ncbi:MAG: redoxin domain-containing protein [Planctomycetota bacterium]